MCKKRFGLLPTQQEEYQFWHVSFDYGQKVLYRTVRVWADGDSSLFQFVKDPGETNAVLLWFMTEDEWMTFRLRECHDTSTYVMFLKCNRASIIHKQSSLWTHYLDAKPKLSNNKVAIIIRMLIQSNQTPQLEVSLPFWKSITIWAGVKEGVRLTARNRSSALRWTDAKACLLEASIPPTSVTYEFPVHSNPFDSIPRDDHTASFCVCVCPPTPLRFTQTTKQRSTRNMY